VKRGLPTIAWVLVGILAIAGFLLSLGTQDNRSRPSAESRSPSGTAALAELLQRSGYRVRVDRRPKPRLDPNAVAVALATSPQQDEDLVEVEGALYDFALDGGRVVVLTLPEDFATASRVRQSDPKTVRNLATNTKYRIAGRADVRLPGDFAVSDVDDVKAGLWELDGQDFLAAFRTGSGTVVEVADATPFTNRFLAEHDHAKAALDIVATVTPPGSEIVFVEAAFGNVQETGLLGTIGPWAVAAWYQTLFLGLVIVATLGKRFGLPVVERRRQEGSRQLLDALADTYLRGKHARIALRTAIGDVENELRAQFRLPRDADLKPFLRELPDPLRTALGEARNALLQDKVEPKEALRLVRSVLEAKAEVGVRASGSRGRV
jgi:hypothetical protein